MIHPERIQPLNKKPLGRGDFVVYWMQASQRAECNHALEYAVGRANDANQPLVAVFALMDDYPEANERHYAFMLEGLAETKARLERRGVQLVVRRGHPAEVAAEMAGRASLLVADRGYLRHSAPSLALFATWLRRGLKASFTLTNTFARLKASAGPIRAAARQNETDKA